MSAPYTALKLIEIKSLAFTFSEAQLQPLLERVCEQLIEKLDEEISLREQEGSWGCRESALGEEIETLQAQVKALTSEFEREKNHKEHFQRSLKNLKDALKKALGGY